MRSPSPISNSVSVPQCVLLNNPSAQLPTNRWLGDKGNNNNNVGLSLSSVPSPLPLPSPRIVFPCRSRSLTQLFILSYPAPLHPHLKTYVPFSHVGLHLPSRRGAAEAEQDLAVSVSSSRLQHGFTLLVPSHDDGFTFSFLLV